MRQKKNSAKQSNETTLSHRTRERNVVQFKKHSFYIFFFFKSTQKYARRGEEREVNIHSVRNRKLSLVNHDESSFLPGRGVREGAAPSSLIRRSDNAPPSRAVLCHSRFHRHFNLTSTVFEFHKWPSPGRERQKLRSANAPGRTLRL